MFNVFCLVFPVLLYLLMWCFVQSCRPKIRQLLGPPLPNGSLIQNYAALVLTGMVFSAYVVICDAFAVHYSFKEDELKLLDDYEDEDVYTFSKITILAILIIDCLSVFLSLLVALLLFCVSLKCCSDNHLMRLIWLFYCVCFCKCLKFKREQKTYDYEVVEAELARDQTTVEKIHVENKAWLLVVSFLAPLVCTGTHAGFVVMAWSSDPDDASSMTVIFALSFLYYFFGFRQLYVILSSWPCLQCNMKNICSLRYHIRAASTELNEYHESLKNFNFIAFFVEILLGTILIGIQGFVFFTYILLPVPLNAVPSNVLNVLQLAFIVGSGLIAYKILTFHTPTEDLIIEKFVDAYCSNTNSHDNEIGSQKTKGSAEKFGEILGDTLRRIVKHQLMETTIKPEATEGSTTTVATGLESTTSNCTAETTSAV